MSSVSIPGMFRIDRHFRRPLTREGRVLALLIAVVLLNAADFVATVWISRAAEIGELNPIAAALLAHGNIVGVGLLKIVSLVVFGGIIISLRRRAVAEWLCWGAVAALGTVVTLWGVLGLYVMRMFAMAPAHQW